MRPVLRALHRARRSSDSSTSSAVLRARYTYGLRMRACVGAGSPCGLAITCKHVNVSDHLAPAYKIWSLVQSAEGWTPKWNQRSTCGHVGCKVQHPWFHQFCSVAKANWSTCARSYKERVCPVYLAWGAAGSVRPANSSKSSANSRKVAVPGASHHCRARSHRTKSVMKGSSHGQLFAVGMASDKIGGFAGLGNGPRSCW